MEAAQFSQLRRAFEPLHPSILEGPEARLSTHVWVCYGIKKESGE